jgi:hypothetical protein
MVTTKAFRSKAAMSFAGFMQTPDRFQNLSNTFSNII